MATNPERPAGCTENDRSKHWPRKTAEHCWCWRNVDKPCCDCGYDGDESTKCVWARPDERRREAAVGPQDGLGGVEATQTAEWTFFDELDAAWPPDSLGDLVEVIENAGINTSWSLSTLRERLAAAKRVRHAPGGADHYPKGSYLSPLDDRELARIVGWDDCLAWLRGEQTP